MKKVVWIVGALGVLFLVGMMFVFTEEKETEDVQSKAFPVEEVSTIEDLNKVIKEIGQEEFSKLIADYQGNPDKFIGKRPCVVDFYATWCGPCKRLAPVLEKIAESHYDKVDFYKVDVDKAQELSEAYRIEAIPTLMFCSTDGKIEVVVGVPSETELREKIGNLK